VVFNDTEFVQRPVVLPDGTRIDQRGPVVIVGPNGSGKSRRARQITSDMDIEIVSALRNTRIAQQLQPMALQQAKQNFVNQKQTARNQPYELANDFDFMLTALIGEASEISLEYLMLARQGKADKLPDLSTLEEIQELWKEFFPGRELTFKDYLPRVTNTIAEGDEPQTYSAWEMSDGEKAALYLCGRALSAPHDSVLIVDEPETHLHSLLASQLWDAIELARPQLRLIYLTHDMTFAASRHVAQYLLANPVDGLRPIHLAEGASEVAAVLLGAASLSFYARRVIFCEGESDSLDARLYKAWFEGSTDVVQPVGSSDMVFKSVQAMRSSQLLANLEVNGIIDRDFRSEETLSSLPEGVEPLGVHEVETLFALPDVVEAVAEHLGRPFERIKYFADVMEKYSNTDRNYVAIERWKLSVSTELTALVSSVAARALPLGDLVAQLPSVFDQKKWDFSPVELLEAEKSRIERAFSQSPADVAQVLRLMPGKNLRAIPAAALSIKTSAYEELIIKSLSDGIQQGPLSGLATRLRAALSPHLPA
jgi:AAA domain, putative AbiEii toxin, Type IV TA system